jgi:hypothetical protein
MAINPACGAGSAGKDRDREEQDSGGHYDAENISDLHLGGRATENVSDFQVLQHLTRYSG